MSRLPSGNPSCPDLSPSLPTGDTFPVKRGWSDANVRAALGQSKLLHWPADLSTCPAAQYTSIIASSGYKFKDGFCLGRWDDFGGTDKENNNKYESSHLVWIWNGKCTNCWSNLGLNSSLMIIDSLSKEDNWQFRVNCGVIAEWNVWVWYPIVRFPASLAFGRASGIGNLTTKPAAFRCRLLVASLLSTSGSFGQ